MRTDPSKDIAFQQHEVWQKEQLDIRLLERVDPDNQDELFFRATPFSGGERNRLFLQRGNRYVDATLISGIDFREDGRGFSVLDFDNDGFQDLAIVSPNEPRFRLVRNRMGDLDSGLAGNRSLQLRLIGGQDGATPSDRWSPRDPFGAQILATVGNKTTAYLLSSSEGLSSQNRLSCPIGIGLAEKIDRLEVRWPSGKVTVRENIGESRLTIYENPQAQPTR